MSETQQREAIDLLAEVWDLSPDVRLGQLFAHIGFLAEVHQGKGLGDIEDEDILSVLRLHLQELRARTPDADTPSQARSSRR